VARTFLQAVNLTLRRIGMVDADLTTFTDSARQTEVDVVLQAWNEVIDDLQDLGVFATAVAEGSITLVAGTKTYAVASDFDGIAADSSGRPIMRDETNGRTIWEYEGGWDRMRRDQLVPGNYSGTPTSWAIDPTTGNFEFNTAPASADAGNIYKYVYSKRINLASTTDTFPFLDDAIDTVIRAVIEIYNRDRKGGWEKGAAPQTAGIRQYNRALARAARKIARVPPHDSYGPRHGAAVR